MEGSRRLLLLAVLIPAVVAAVGPQPGAPCEPTLLAEQVALFCAPGMPPARCCERVVLVVDLGVPCVCRVAAEPQLVTAGLNVTHLVEIYGSCGGAHLAAACEGPASPAAVVSSPPPPPPSAAPRRKQPAPAYDAPPPPPSSEKPSSQEHDGGAAHNMAVPTQAAASPVSATHQPAGDAPAPQPSPPPQHDVAENVFLVLGYVFTGVLYFSQGPTVWGIWVARQVGQNKVDMFVLTLISCIIWMMYGLADPPTPPFAILNGVGIAFELLYLGLFLCFFTPLGRTKLAIGLAVIAVASAIVAACVFSLAPKPQLVFGIFGDVISVVMYAGPLREVISVWREKNVGNMSLLVAVALFLNGVSWTAYGHLADNIYFTVPGYFGIVFGALQVLVWVVVRFIYQG